MGGFNMSKVMLLHLPILNYIQKDFVDEESGYNPSLGIMALGTYLELNGYKPIVIDMCYDRMKVSELIDRIKLEKPILIGLSVYTENFYQALKLSRIIKKEVPDIKIVFGGPHPTLQPNECIENEEVDFVIMKEGESTILELMEALGSGEKTIRYEQIPGLLFKRENVVVKNVLRKHILDLNLLPIIKRELADIHRYGGFVNISTSRGCPGRCIYCSATSLSGATYRTRNEYSIFMEMLLLKIMFGNKILKIYIVDDTFTAIPNRITKFLDLIFYYDLEVHWQCESRIDVMDEELLYRMHKAGCIAIQYGIESGSQEVLNKLKKGIDLEQAKKIIEITHKNRIVTCLSFMLGHYCDTKETMWQTAYFIQELFHKYRAELAVSFNTPFPGTWQFIHRDKLGMRLVTNSYNRYSLLEPIVETDNFTIEDQREVFFFCKKFIGYHESLSKLGEE